MTKAASGSATPETHQIGFVGLGIMGKSMARHLMAKGYVLNAYTRTMSKIEDLLSEGAVWHDTPAAVAAKSDIVITMVGYPKDVEEVYFGSDGQAGILDAARPGTILVDMTTSAPSLAAKIAEAAAEKGMASIDAPVSGGDVGAKNAALSIMCGGDQAAFEAVLPVFEVMGKAIVLLGPPGAGQHTKMVNQTVICGTLTGVAEGMSYAKAAGLDPAKVLDVIGGGAASSFQLNVLGPKMLAGDYAPGFFAHHFLKDMTISAGEAEEMGLDLPVLELTKSLFEALLETPEGQEMGTHGIISLYDSRRKP